jgi:hypothetical protein
VLVRRGHLDQRHVQREDAAPEEERDLAEEHREIVRPPGLDRFPIVGRDEERVGTEAPGAFGGGVGGGAFGVKVDDFDVAQLGRTAGQRLDQELRRSSDAVDEHAVAGLHDGNGFFGGHVSRRHGASSFTE